MRVDRRRLLTSFCALPALHPAFAAAGASVSDDWAARIREEALTRSKLLTTLKTIIGFGAPRLTGSESAVDAGRRALQCMASWGMQNGRLERWAFGHAGWTSSKSECAIVSPFREPLYVRPAAWTPGTGGLSIAGVTLIDPPDHVSPDTLAAYFAKVRPVIAGKHVMVGKASPVEMRFEPVAYRLDDTKIAEFLHPPPYEPEALPDPSRITGRARDIAINEHLLEAGARVRIRDSHRRFGELHAFTNLAYDLTKSPPVVAMRNEDYCRIARLIDAGTDVRLGFDIQNLSLPAGRACYNVVAEIPGSDLSDQVVMVGAHLDCWHLANGATDDAVGCAIMMEAARILLAVGAKPRRTFRVALWTGEEQGLLGSQSYVAEHFGTAEAPRPEFDRLAAYINIDGGSGRVRGANVFGPDEDAAVLGKILAPYADLGVAGAVAHKVRKLRNTDATTFSRAGLPAIGLFQDPLDNEDAWHSNLDTLERVSEADASQAAAVAAGLAFALATQEKRLARFGPREMPPAEGPPPVAKAIVSLRSRSMQLVTGVAEAT